MDLEKRDSDMQFGSKVPFLAIWMVTYNHEQFIQQAVESVMMQKTNFNYKLFIGEDCSTDTTRQICNELKEKYPDKIELFLNETNIGGTQNALQIYKECFESGAKYIAMLEADDYWTDPHKLQIQVDFLEANQEYVLSFHQVQVLQMDGDLVEDSITTIPNNYETVETLAKFGNYIHTPSVVYRNCLKSMPIEFAQTPIGDYFLYMLLAQYGKLKHIEKPMAVYRYGVGVFSGNNSDVMLYKSIKTFVLIASALKDKKDIVAILLNRIYGSLKFFNFHIDNGTPSLLLQQLNKEKDNAFLKQFLVLYLPFVSEKLTEKKLHIERNKLQTFKYHLKGIIKTVIKR
ncbi:glycosyltransferase [Flavobacterium sp. GCM10027622]|uniref:glycosyltransferase n=1 Tax=unclassified Flavobacterium TaxID=196869 RepID=UPI00361AD5E8